MFRMSKIEETEAIQRWGNVLMQIKTMIRKHINSERTFWKWPTLFMESTKWTTFPRKVYTPMAMTIISISPCLHVDPKNTSSPGLFVAGIDFLVIAYWLTKDHGQAILCEKTYNICLSSRIFIQELIRTTIIITKLHNMLFSLLRFQWVFSR